MLQVGSIETILLEVKVLKEAQALSVTMQTNNHPYLQ
jgi:hypothetical protein